MDYDLKHHGVYAFILNEAQSDILLIKKSIGPYAGLLDLPGGTPEDQETPEQTIISEVMEETGADVRQLFRAINFDLIVDYMKQDRLYKLNHTGLVYKASINTTIEFDVQSSDTNGCLWFPLDQVNENKVALPTLKAIEGFL